MTLNEAMHSAIAHHQAGRLADAEKIYRQILSVQPNHVDALHLLGVLAGQHGQNAVAIDLIKRALAIKPDHVQALSNLANFLVAAGKPQEAVDACNRAIQIDPGYSDAFNNLGNALVELRRYEEAIPACSRAVQLDPQCAGAYNNLGNALRELDRAEEALPIFERVLALAPGHPGAHSNRGLTFARLGRREEAIESYHRALQLDPNLALARNNLAQELMGMQQFEQALAEYRRAIALKPNEPLYHWNLSLALLSLGQFEEGWKEFDLGNSGIWANNRLFPPPQWDGQNPRGKNILLHQDDGGFGDFFHFVRYAKILKDMGANLILECRDSIIPLMAGTPYVDQVISQRAPPGSLDFHISLRRLPRIFKTELENIPNSVPYIKAPAEYLDRWRPRIAGKGLKVGLCWSGGSHSRFPVKTRLRSADLFAALSPIRGVQYFSLQKETRVNDPRPPGLNMIDLTDDIHDFADTAAIIELLDLVISIDTSIPHLAGALAKPVWVLLTHHADFRWLRNRTDTPWYPTMKLFRQQTPDDFSLPISQVAEALKEMVR